MMALKKRFTFCFLMLCQLVLAQQPVLNPLEEVQVQDLGLQHYSSTQSVLRLKDSIIEKNQPSLTALLNYNSVVYFKENGLGMVSSPSFRGTTAQQTAVVWNGININSQLNGQTDFNTVNTKDFNSIAVRAGGGSVLYGSSAVGGTIHLNSGLAFDKLFSNEIQAQYGSFNTLGINYKLKWSDARWSAQVSLSRNQSENDYPYHKANLKNENGQYYNTGYNAAFGYQINASHFLKCYSQVFDGQRHFSLASPSETKTKYQDFNTRHMLEWSSFQQKYTTQARLAYLTEHYNYYGNIADEIHAFGKVATLIGKYDFSYHISEKITIDAVADFSQSQAQGSDIKPEKRQVGSGSLLLRHSVAEKFKYDLGLRKEITSNYQSPVLFSAGAASALTRFYTLKVNFSRNFRVPTFNDLYWTGVGNPDLKPESAYQGEIGNDFKFGDFKLSATFYHSRIRDMIRWIPTNGGLFAPENTNSVWISGAELLLDWHTKIGKSEISFKGTYAYTNSENRELHKQLIYVPYHKMTGCAAYSCGKFSATYQHLFTGSVFTQSDNNPGKTVAMYNVSNISADYDFGKANVYRLGFRVLNLWDENYQSFEDRPLPGRNFNLYLTLIF